MIGSAIYSRLSTDTGVSALVSNRIYPEESVENNYPFIVYSVQRESDPTFGADGGSVEHTLTVTIESLDAQVLASVSDAVHTSLNKSTFAAGGVNVMSFFQDSEDSSITDNQNSERIYYSTVQTYKVWADA